ncbi:MAG: hypothetical protein ACJAZO_003525 [Myxococcota bacterium]|jgi:hypothetical protein
MVKPMGMERLATSVDPPRCKDDSEYRVVQSNALLQGCESKTRLRRALHSQKRLLPSTLGSTAWRDFGTLLAISPDLTFCRCFASTKRRLDSYLGQQSAPRLNAAYLALRSRS